MVRKSVLAIGIAIVMLSLMFGNAAFAACEPGVRTVSMVIAQDVPDPGVVGDNAVEDPVGDPTEPLEYPIRIIEQIAAHFDVAVEDVADLYESGLGLGVIVHVYALAETLEITPEEVLTAWESGELGWGEVLNSYLDEESPRNGTTLGHIMSVVAGNRGGAQPNVDPDAVLEPDISAIMDTLRDRVRDRDRLRDPEQDPQGDPQQTRAETQFQQQTQQPDTPKPAEPVQQQTGSGAGGNSNGGGSGSGANSNSGGGGKGK